MKTEIKTLIFPGNSGQASLCYYRTGLDESQIRPKVVILIWDSPNGLSTPVNNNPFIDDIIVNRIMELECKGLSAMDVLIVTPHILQFQPPVLKRMPINMFAPRKLTVRDRTARFFGKTVTDYINLSDKKCGEFVFETKDPLPLAEEDEKLVNAVFPNMSSAQEITEMYAMYCNTTDTQEKLQ